jgi:hypothetical protein
MSATFYSGFKDTDSVLSFLMDNIYSAFQMRSNICVVLKDSQSKQDFEVKQKQKYFENSKIEYLYAKNIEFLETEPQEQFDEIHIFSDKVANLDINLSKNVYVYTTLADEEVNKASRTLYTNLKLKNFELKHEAI